MSVSLPTNAVALTLENIKESKKKNMCWFWDLNRGPWDHNIGLACSRIITTTEPDWFPTLKVWVFIIKNVEFWSGEQVIQGVQPVSNTRPPTSKSQTLSS